MKQKQDGKRIAEYNQETEDDIRKLLRDKGAGGAGNHEPPVDIEERGLAAGLEAGKPPKPAGTP